MRERVQDFVDASPYSDHVTLVHENNLRGTAGTLIDNLDFFERKDGLLIHADNYCLEDFNDFLQAHNQRPSCCVMTMMTFRSETPSSCGVVELDSHGIVVGFYEKLDNPPGNLANGAVYLLSAELLKIMGSEFCTEEDFSTGVVNKLVGRIFTYETKNFFRDIGTPEAYEMVNKSYFV